MLKKYRIEQIVYSSPTWEITWFDQYFTTIYNNIDIKTFL